MRYRTTLWIAVMTAIFPACSHEKALLASYDAYTPPAVVFAPASPIASHNGNGRKSVSGASAEASWAERMRRQWDSSLKNIPAGNSSGKSSEVVGRRFYTPPETHLTALRPAATDAAIAAKALSGSFTLETLEILTLLRNPEVIAAENTFRGKLNAYSQVTNLDDILQQYSAYTQSLMTGVGDAPGTTSPDMKFPFPGVVSLKGDIVQQEIRIARENLEIARRTAVTDARIAYWKLCYNLSAQATTRSTLDLIAQLDQSARKRYEVGKGMLQDAIQPRIQQALLEETLKTLQETGETLHSNIRKLVDIPEDSKVGPPRIQAPQRRLPSLETLASLAMNHRQELESAQATVARTERMIAMGETETYYPRFTQNLSLFENKAVTQVGTGATETPFPVIAEASMGQGAPKNPWFGFDNAYLQETRETLKAQRQDLKNVENDTRYRVRDGWFKLAQALRKETLYAKTVTGLSALSGETVRQRYESGIAGMRDVIDAYMAWYEARLAGERGRSDIGIARASLEAVVGTSW